MKNKLFENEIHGMIEIYFTPDELASTIDLLNFVKGMCSELLKNTQGTLTPEMVTKFSTTQLTAALLTEKLVLDSDPGRPHDFWN